jgi:hypothetical protein
LEARVAHDLQLSCVYSFHKRECYGAGFVICCCLFACVRFLQRRRRARFPGAGLDAEERRFKRRIEREIQVIDDIFEDGADDNNDDVELDAKDIEQLKLLELELAKRAGKAVGCL